LRPRRRSPARGEYQLHLGVKLTLDADACSRIELLAAMSAGNARKPTQLSDAGARTHCRLLLPQTRTRPS